MSRDSGAIRALKPQTGEVKWEFKMGDVTDAGILTTASDLLQYITVDAGSGLFSFPLK